MEEQLPERKASLSLGTSPRCSRALTCFASSQPTREHRFALSWVETIPQEKPGWDRVVQACSLTISCALTISHGGEILTGGHRQIPSHESHDLSRVEPSQAPAFPAPWGLTAAQVSSGGSGQLWPKVSCTFGALGSPELQQPYIPCTQSRTSPALKNDSEESPTSERRAARSCTVPALQQGPSL